MFEFLRSLLSPRGEQQGWYRSENGNLTCVRNGLRLTVFQDQTYGGWDYCIAKDSPGSKPGFSHEKYKTEEAAKRAAEEEAG